MKPCSTITALMGVVFLLFAPWAAQAEQTPAEKAASSFIEQVGNQALTVIKNPSASSTQKQARLEKLFSDNVDIPWVAKFVMGRYWRQASDAQKSRYMREYKNFLIKHYTARFADYTSGTFKITDSRASEDGEFTVGMELISGDKKSEPVLVDYRVRKQGGSYIIFDIIVEGVSLITTQRAEFNSVMNGKGIDHLIDQLANRSMPSSLPKS